MPPDPATAPAAVEVDTSDLDVQARLAAAEKERDALKAEKAQAEKAQAEQKAARRAAAEAEVRRRYDALDAKVRERIGAKDPRDMLTALRALEAAPPKKPVPGSPGLGPPSGLAPPAVQGFVMPKGMRGTQGGRDYGPGDVVPPIGWEDVRPPAAAEKLGLAPATARTR